MNTFWSTGLVVFALGMSLALTGCPPPSTPLGPEAEFDANVTFGTAPFEVLFADLSLPGDSPITQWAWDFGDGATSTEQNPDHTYASTAAGNNSVQLTVTTADGQDTMSRFGFITVTARVAGDVDIVMLPGNVPLELVWMPAGAFMMGRYSGELNSNVNEDLQHQVTFSEGFWIGKYEVTQAQWNAVMGAGNNPAFFQGGTYGVTDTRPMERVSWDTAQSFIAALNAASGRTLRLPSEAEWEYACRAGNQVPPTRYYWGDDLGTIGGLTPLDIGTYAWFMGNSGSQTKNVGTAGTTGHPNAWGLYDMSGNVWEWCEDDWHAGYTGAPTDGRAWWDTPSGMNRVLRGGSWNSEEKQCRSATRIYVDKTFGGNSNMGFRLAG